MKLTKDQAHLLAAGIINHTWDRRGEEDRFDAEDEFINLVRKLIDYGEVYKKDKNN